MGIGEIEIGKYNRSLGWFWMIFVIALGMYSAMNIGSWMQAGLEELARNVGHAHAMGIVGAAMNIMYGNRIDDVPLDGSLRFAGGALALLGMIGITLVWLGTLVGVPSPVASLVGLVWMLAVVILGYGELRS